MDKAGDEAGQGGHLSCMNVRYPRKRKGECMQVYGTHRCMVHAGVWSAQVYGARRCMAHADV